MLVYIGIEDCQRLECLVCLHLRGNMYNLPHFTHILCSFLSNLITNHYIFSGKGQITNCINANWSIINCNEEDMNSIGRSVETNSEH